jgi:ribosome assembly protein YihI (activator of Der GTPase)
MTRQKKTRSAGSNGQRHLPAQEIRKSREPKEETKKKGAGLKSGSRNNVAIAKPNSSDNAANKDKRLGSKKPIELLPVSSAPIDITQPKASLAKVKPAALSPEQELALIENDTYLQQLLERV